MGAEKAGEALFCDCGERLADQFDGRNVTVDGQTFQFRRTTDYLACSACGAFHRITDLTGATPLETDDEDQALADLHRLNVELEQKLADPDTPEAGQA